MAMKTLQINNIKSDKNQPRKTFDEESLQGLAESILSNGLIVPIDIDENNVIIDGERRYRAHKLAGLKNIDCRIIKLKKDNVQRLKRQLISDLQNEELSTGERYEAIVRLYEMMGPTVKETFCNELGINKATLNSALDYCNFVEEEPELAKSVSPHIITETKSLPREEREEIIEEFKEKKDKKKDLIREMVKQKKEELQTKKDFEELEKKNKIIKKAREAEIRLKTTEEAFENLRGQIEDTTRQLQKAAAVVGVVRRTKKFYFAKAKAKQDFFRFLDGTIKKYDKYLTQLKDLRENIELELIST